jgi:uncharacterized protein YbjT (DUF2867 family)
LNIQPPIAKKIRGQLPFTTPQSSDTPRITITITITITMSASTPRPAILVLGGTGKVGSRIVRQLRSYDTNHLVLVASRNATKQQSEDDDKVRHVTFDWDNTDTWSNPFSALPAGTTLSAVYIIAPGSLNAETLMNGFVDFAHERGVRRFVLQSASCIEEGGVLMGKVHAHLRELGQKGEVEWAVLRPTWFQRMFLISFDIFFCLNRGC